MQRYQFAKRVLMVRPTCFFSNPETIVDNHFMESPFAASEACRNSPMTAKAQDEFDLLVDKLRHSGIDVDVHQQQKDDLPDSVFPRDWFSTHRDAYAYPNGLLVTYPMKTPSREAEKNPAILSKLAEQYAHRADIQATDGAVLEGAGTLVFDREGAEHTVWCSMSQRADRSKLDEFVSIYNDLK